MQRSSRSQQQQSFSFVVMGAVGLAIALIAYAMLAASFGQGGARASDARVISVFADGQKRVITSDADTVAEALKDAGVSTDGTDLVEPGLDTAIPVGFFNVNVYRARPVQVVDGAKTHHVVTALQSPRLAAQAAGVKLHREDLVESGTVTDFTEAGTVGQKVIIKRATPIVIQADGQRTVARTQQKTVGAVLAERDVALGPKDVVVTPQETKVQPNMVIEIKRIAVVVQKQTLPIAFETKTIKDAAMTAGDSKVEQEGKEGSKVATFRVHFTNGAESQRELLAEEVAAQPTTKVVRVGTKVVYSSSPVELGRQLAAERGWTGAEWDALYRLWQKESGWNPASRNLFSGACGIPQAYPCSKIPDMSPAGQIRWGLGYIAGRYGSPSKAYAYWQRNNSY